MSPRAASMNPLPGAEPGASPRDATPSATPGRQPSSNRPFVVGIGSSAGGLEALTALLPGLPTGLGLTFVVVQHMSPTHRSLMAQLLGRVTPLPVLEVHHGCMPAADTVYITPPNHNVVMAEDGSLQLLEPPNETVPKPSVNLFFESLADVVADRAIGVVLSGTGSDGAIGLHAVKAAGGFSLAQEPGGAKYDGMIRAAIEAGGVDWILPAEAIGPEIGRVVQRQKAAEGRAVHADHVPPATLQTLLHGLYAQTRIDFTGYKEATLLRRIERRMTSTGCLSLDQYVELARSNAEETQALAQDMLISVTSFFRDRMAFDRLREELVRLLENKPPGEEVRVWVAGCASGEEAYSMAMILHDALKDQRPARQVQIFASDIDEAALARARRAVYPASLVNDLDPSTLERHFVRHADGYEVGKALRNLVVFARHNLVQDPPFVRLDLVSCRNVLIYMQAPLQERLLRTFHYALGPGGLLFLGRSETNHNSDSLFESVDRGAHLFRRLSGVSRLPAVRPGRDEPSRKALAKPANLDDLVARAVTARFAPATLLVDAAGDVRHLKGDLQGLVQLPDGRPAMQLMTLLRRELRPELARLIRLVREASPDDSQGAHGAVRGAGSDEPVTGRWRTNRALSKEFAIRLSVQRVHEASGAPLLLVCFERRPLAEPSWPVATDLGENAVGADATALEEALAATREHLYTVIEELETSNEEAQSLNEEIQTANEELQSTNEELEASNEELQASNEELTTVNEELQVKSLEWQALNAELEGIYGTVDFPLMAFDERSILTRTNLAAKRQLAIDEQCLGKHVMGLPWRADMPALHSEFDKVQATGRTEVRQLAGIGGRDWLLRIMPRLGSDGSRAGVLVQMEDNTELRRTQAEALRTSAQLQQLVANSAHLLCICDPAGRLQMANPEFERWHGLEPGSATGKLVTEVLAPERALAFLDAQIQAIRLLGPVEQEEALPSAEGTRSLLAAYYPLLDADGAVWGVCYQALDITRRKQAEAALLAANSAQLAAEGIARTKGSFLANMSHEIRTPMNAVLGLSRMVLQEELSETVRDRLSKIHEAAQALTRILDDVLDFSKIEAGALRFEHRAFSLYQVLSGVKSLFSANAQERQLALTVDVPLGIPQMLVGDAFRLSQVLNNLVSNALKFTRAGSVRVGVMPLDDALPRADTCVLRFSVRDTGVGIAEHQRQALFQPFAQGDSTITRRFGGTGLGLAICQRLVHMMHGRIGVNSAVDEGSEFWFTAEFEIARTTADAEAVAVDPSAPARRSGASAVAVAEPAGPPVRNPRVLLVEDNALNQIVAKSVLEGLGYVVTVAGDGAEALEEVRAQAVGCFGMVLMDMHMPVMDGLEATRRIRTLPQGEDLPILALTAAALAEDRDMCLAAGMNGHISKPLEPEQLVVAMRSLELDSLGSQRRAAHETPAARAGVEPLPVEFVALEGYDLSPLWARTGGSRDLMWRLLQTFVDEQARVPVDLRAALEDCRREDARHQTHTLMGAAAAIGAMRVAEHSRSLNTALRAGGQPPASLLRLLTESLETCLDSARTLIARRQAG